jgi:hypothetical protein
MDTDEVPKSVRTFAAVAAAVAALVGAGVGAYVTLRPEPTPDRLTAGICTVGGIVDTDYVNAILTGRSGSGADDRVTVVGDTNPDEDLWYLRRVHRDGANWRLTASDKWEVSTPHDVKHPDLQFTFRVFAEKRHVKLPPHNKGIRLSDIPHGLRQVGDDVTRSRQQLIHSKYQNPSC